MGTLGCCPAFDRYFKSGLAIENIEIQIYGKLAIIKLITFCSQNNELFEKETCKIKIGQIPYPQMKLLDMGLWKIWFDADTKKFKVSH